ncbi:MAG: hypothetical protein SOU84_04260 [Candidatus Faecimonas sp.]|nr:SGNH/GDSL hydrolase family protein [Mycoplasmatota bacterium]MDY2908355.1 hypothetical protein [Candidatus Faecimonas sp.]
MKKILIYGDSNTWGDNFITGERIPEEKQWVNILRTKYGNKYQFFQEGLPGRIAGNEETIKTYKNGKDTFISTFRTNAPVDKIIIALGTNDLQIKYQKTKDKIIEDLLWYKKQIEESYADLEDQKKYFNDKKLPEIIYILPINFDYQDKASVIFDKESEEKRQQIIREFQKDKKLKTIVANDLELFDDGIHLNYQGHEQMASLVERFL